MAASAAGKDSRPHPLFSQSLNPMLIADDERRYLDANAAACLFLRLPHDSICKLRIDDITPAELLPGLRRFWAAFLADRASTEGVQARGWDFRMPDGTTVPADLSSTPDFRPGRHLGIIVFPPAATLDERVSNAQPPVSEVLTKRERQVLTLVALGNTGVEIAAELYLSPTTVQTHVVNALTKLRAKNRAHGIPIALQTGELDLDNKSIPSPRPGARVVTDDRDK